MKKKSTRIAGIFIVIYGFYNIGEFINSEHNQILGITSGAVLVLIGAYSLYGTAKKNH